MTTRLAPVAISMGDPTGVGPEIIVRALAARPGLEAVVYGDPDVLAAAARACGAAVPARMVSTGRHGPHAPGAPTAASGAAQVAALVAAVDAVVDGACSALCTAPIHKQSAHAAGFAYPGHTEYLAHRAGDPPHAMMLTAARPGALRVVLATTHVALARVPALLSPALIARTIVLCARALVADFGLEAPRIAVCGLNPHAGEAGAFGREEAEVIAPAMALARQELAGLGLGPVRLDGPAVPDAVFRAAVTGAHDAVVCQYHDQGLIPFKLLHFDDGVNVTIGLPFVRTSPDHGTAHDIAGRGVVRPDSFVAALDMAAAMAARRATRAR
ncbi:MAG TPA: 4-hydroxythreonine-4-phosphate dehydrogenase PdxA [Polyangia bacterium]